MRISFLGTLSRSFRTELLVLPVTKKTLVFSSKGSSQFLGTLDKSLKQALSKAISREAFQADAGKSLYFSHFNDKRFQGILFFGLETKDRKSLEYGMLLEKLGECVQKTASTHRFSHVMMIAPDFSPGDLSAVVENLLSSEYKFENYKAHSKEKKVFSGIKEINFVSESKLSQTELGQIQFIKQGVFIAKNLANTPAKECTPQYIVERAKELAKDLKLKIEILDKKRLEKLGAHALLSVSEGSPKPPYLIKLTYSPDNKPKKVLAFVGKGVTFDSGGVSIKPSAGLEDMKYDMSGAAAVLGAMHAIASLKPRVEVRAYLPVTENMVDGSATHPGDVITALNGKTIEVINTDAEGRLILADAICLAEQDGCDEIVDLATLTGSIVTALGLDYAGLYSNNQELANRLLQVARDARELVWQMPLVEHYAELLKSTIADVKNLSDRSFGAGSITGALFLKEFVSKVKWAHIDMAGPGFSVGLGKYAKAGASGFGVRTLTRYAIAQSDVEERSS